MADAERGQVRDERRCGDEWQLAGDLQAIGGERRRRLRTLAGAHGTSRSTNSERARTRTVVWRGSSSPSALAGAYGDVRRAGSPCWVSRTRAQPWPGGSTEEGGGSVKSRSSWKALKAR